MVGAQEDIMAQLKQQIVEADLVPADILPQPASPAAVHAIGDVLPEPIRSPARELQQLLEDSAADLRLPLPEARSNELPIFILAAVALWGGVLGSIAGLMVLVR